MLKNQAVLFIEKITMIPFEGFEQLKKESLSDGFNFLVRLESEWNKAENRFDQDGEGIYALFKDHKLVGIGGVNRISQATDNERIGRLRRFYISKAHRRNGFGKILLDYILMDAKLHFNTIQLKTDALFAAKFYENFGFNTITGDTTVTHELNFSEDQLN
jgi:GNAT superfamily N-acetyltransferase